MNLKTILFIRWILVWVITTETWIVYGLVRDGINAENLISAIVILSGFSAIITMVVLFGWCVMSPFKNPFEGI